MAGEPVSARQRELNAWTDRYLDGVHRLVVDGRQGKATNRRIMMVKWYLGYGKRDASWNSAFVRKLRHPHSARYSPPWQLALGARRRVSQRQHYAQSQQARTGLGTFDGKTVAAWMLPQLQWARAHGWSGVVLSGYRTPAYSRSLCYAMCGAPRCPGMCAGTASRHSQYRKPDGAVDVSDPEAFESALRGCPELPRLVNNLPNDRNHHSAEGN